MDQHFPVSVPHATIEAGHDNKSAPGGAPTPKPRALPTELGHDRLMHKVQPPADTPPALCPCCGRNGTGHYLESIPADVPRVQYLCDSGDHIWITSWFAPKDGAA